jgi:hypothetical protein
VVNKIVLFVSENIQFMSGNGTVGEVMSFADGFLEEVTSQI